MCHLLTGRCCFRKQRAQQTGVQNVQPEENGIANYRITYSTMNINLIPPSPTPKHWFSKIESPTSSINTIWKLARDTNSQVPPKTS